MLVLTRKAGEEIVIGDEVKVIVNRITGNRVTIGISAPSQIRIIRGELQPIVTAFDVELDAVTRENHDPEQGLDDPSRLPFAPRTAR